MKRTLIACSLFGLAASSIALATELRTPLDVTTALNAAGYGHVRDVEFDDGLWEAEVRRQNGRWSDVHVDPTTGDVLDASTATLLSAADVIVLLANQGYEVTGGLEREDGLWEAEASDAQGQRLDLRIDGRNGRVLFSEVDHDD